MNVVAVVLFALCVALIVSGVALLCGVPVALIVGGVLAGAGGWLALDDGKSR